MGVKIIDVIFALVSGYAVGWVARDFLKGYGIEISFLHSLLLHYVLPVVFLFCLWLSRLIGRKFLFVFQASKHLIIGGFATVIDLKLFEFLAWTSSVFFPMAPLFSKAVSFLIATLVKYWGNKHWAFEKFEKEKILKEILQFFIVTIIGLILDVGLFYYFIKIMGVQFAMPAQVWVKLSVILAAIAAAFWNFTAYKFLVFKK